VFVATAADKSGDEDDNDDDTENTGSDR